MKWRWLIVVLTISLAFSGQALAMRADIVPSLKPYPMIPVPTANITVTVRIAVAPTVTTASATGISDTYATLNGNIVNTGGKNCDYRGFEWGLSSGNYSDNWTQSGSFGAGAFSRLVDNLSANTTYFYRAYAHNNLGLSYGGEVSFNTLGEIVEAPGNFKLTALLDCQILAEWDPVDGATGYVLLVSTAGHPDDPEGNYAVAYSGNQTSVVLYGYNLEFTKYKFSLWTQHNPYSEDYATASIGGEGITELTGQITDIWSILLPLLPMIPIAFIAVLAFWHHDMLLYVIAGLGFIVYGFTIWTIYWYLSIFFVIVGLYSFAKAAWDRRRRA